MHETNTGWNREIIFKIGGIMKKLFYKMIIRLIRNNRKLYASLPLPQRVLIGYLNQYNKL